MRCRCMSSKGDAKKKPGSDTTRACTGIELGTLDMQEKKQSRTYLDCFVPTPPRLRRAFNHRDNMIVMEDFEEK
jgi:hypothetical protein